MGNLVLATPILSDAAALAAVSETTAGPVTNLQLMQPTDIWESDDAGGVVTINFGAVTDFNLVAVLHTNAVATDTWRVRTADTEAGLTAAPDHDSGSVTLTGIGAEGTMFHWVEAGLSNQWIRIDFTTAADPFMAGRLFVADALITSRNYTYGYEDGYEDSTGIDETDAYNLIPNAGGNRAVLNFTMTLDDETERHAIREINRLRGASKDVLVIRDPDASSNFGDHIYHGLLQARRVAVHTAFNHHQVPYQLRCLATG